MSNLTNFSVKEVPKFITNHYEKFIKDQLKNYMKPETDSKLQTFAKCYVLCFFCFFYYKLHFNTN
jgi:hypothetical protein